MNMFEHKFGCLTCFQPSGFNYVKVQSVISAQEALRKHFWFTEAEIQQAIMCKSCWDQVDNFCRFYVSVEELYKNQISFEINVKPDPDQLHRLEGVLPVRSITTGEVGTEPLQNSTSANENNSELIDSDNANEELVEPLAKGNDYEDGYPIGKRRGVKRNLSEDECIKTHVKYICDQCGNESETFSVFKEHALQCHQNKSPFLICCRRKYSTRRDLFQHVQLLDNPNQYHCQECEKSFRTRPGYFRHRDMCHAAASGEPLFECDECPQSFTSQHLYQQHKESHANNANGGEFGKGLPTTADLQSHNLRRHSANQPVVADHYDGNVLPDMSYDGEMDVENVELHQDLRVVLPDCLSDGLLQCTGTNSDNDVGQLIHSIVVKEEPLLEAQAEELVQQSGDKCEMEYSIKIFDATAAQDKLPSNLKMYEVSDAFIREHVKFICKKCRQESLTFELFKNHALEVHGEKSVSVACCGKNYRRKNFLIKHIQMLNIPALFQCKQCTKSYHTSASLRKHTRHVHGNKRFKCDRCFKIFSAKHLLWRHKESHLALDNRKWKCPFCKKIYPNCYSVNNHVRKYHPEAPEFSCDICNLKFRSELWLQEHKRKHKQLQCLLCPLLFPDGPRLRSHVQKCHRGVVLPVTCTLCRAVLPSKDALDAHRIQEHKRQLKFSDDGDCLEDGQPECSGNDLGFRYESPSSIEEEPIVVKETEADLQSHHMLRHLANQPVVAVDYDGNVLQDRSYDGEMDVENEELQQDLRVVLPDCLSEGLVQCPDTNSDNETKQLVHFIVVKEEPVIEPQTEALVQQEATVAQDKLPNNSKKVKMAEVSDELIREHLKFICKKCGQDSLTFELFKNHALEVHGDKSVSVSCCGKNFKRKTFLIKHIQTLNIPALFHCKPCSKSFHTLTSLRKHTRHVHGNKRYKCDRCFKIFSAKHLLWRHKESHLALDNRKWKCPFCKKIYPNCYSVNNHVRNYHPEAPEFSCDVCNLKFRSEVWLQEHTLKHKQLQCLLCPLMFPDGASLRSHVQKCHRGVGLPVTCTLCRAVLPSKHALDVHRIQEHKRQIMFTDDGDCLKDAQPECSGNDLDIRTDSPSIVKEEPLVVEETEEIVQQIEKVSEPEKSEDNTEKGNLDDSETLVVKQNSPPSKSTVSGTWLSDDCIRKHVKFICGECGEESLTFNLFKSHAFSVHGDLQPRIECCGRKYRRRYRLCVHVLEQLNPPTYRCEDCNESYDFKLEYKQHMRIFHEGVFKCDQCPKSYSRKFTLNKHKLTHLHADQPLGRDKKERKCAKVYQDGKSLYREQEDSDYLEESQSEWSGSDAETDQSDSSVSVKESQPRKIVQRKPYDGTVDLASFDLYQDLRVVLTDCVVEGHPECPVNILDDYPQDDWGTAMAKRGERSEDKADAYIREHVRYICEHCKHESLTFKLFLKHALKVHNDQSASVKCCGKKFRKKYNLMEHVQSINNPTMFRCKHCTKNFNSSDKLRQHHRQIHGSKMFKCDRCPKSYATMNRLWRHKEDHLDIDNRKWMCPYCQKVCPNQYSVNDHIRVIHPKAPEFVCDVCPKKFRIELWLQEHKLKHKEIQCLLCPKLFRYGKFLRAHVMSAHPEAELPMLCIMCRVLLPSKEALIAHRAEVHKRESLLTDDGDYVVEGEANNSNADMKKGDQDDAESEVVNQMGLFKENPDEYIRKHVRYICETCGEESLTFKQYKEHAYENHRDPSAAIECCGMTFRRKTRLWEHVHTVNNPAMFRCEDCNKSYAYNAGYQQHLKRVHRNRRFECDQCSKTFTSQYRLRKHKRTDLHLASDKKLECDKVDPEGESSKVQEHENPSNPEDVSPEETLLCQNQLVSVIVKSETEVGEGDCLEEALPEYSRGQSVKTEQREQTRSDSDSHHSTDDEQEQDE